MRTTYAPPGHPQAPESLASALYSCTPAVGTLFWYEAGRYVIAALLLRY